MPGTYMDKVKESLKEKPLDGKEQFMASVLHVLDNCLYKFDGYSRLHEYRSNLVNRVNELKVANREIEPSSNPGTYITVETISDPREQLKELYSSYPDGIINDSIGLEKEKLLLKQIKEVEKLEKRITQLDRYEAHYESKR